MKNYDPKYLQLTLSLIFRLKMIIQSEQQGAQDLNPAKQKLINLTTQLLQKFKISTIAFTAIKIIEAMQMVYFLMRSRNQDYHWNYSVVGYFSMAINLISLDSLFKSDPGLFSTVLLIGASGFFAIMLLSVLVAWYSGWGEKTPFIIKLSTPVLYIFFYLLKTILIIPILTLILISIVPQASQSYNIDMQSHVTYTVALLFLALFLVAISYTLFMLRQENPFSQLPYAGQSILKGILWALFKLSMVLTTVLDMNGAHLFPLIIGYSLGYLFFIIQGHWEVGIFRKYNQKLQMVLIYFSFSLSILRCIDIDGQETTTLAYLLPFKILAYLTYEWIVNRQLRSIAILNPHQNDDFNLLEKHILYLINLIDGMNQRPNLLLLEGYLHIHRRQCRGGETCPCRNLVFLKQRNQGQVKQQFFKLVVTLLLDGRRKFPDEKKIELYLCLIYHYRTKNYLQAIYSIYKMVKKDSKSLQDRFYFSFYLQYIQKQMAQLDGKETTHSIDVNKYMDYTHKMVVLENNIETCTRHHIEFWRLIMDSDPEIKRLQDLGTLITRSKQQLRQQFDSIYQANPNSIHLLTIYAKFQLEVTNQESYNVKYLQKADAIYKNIKQSKKIDERSNKYNQNANTAVVIISGDQGHLGNIVHTNNLTKGILGYKRADLLQKNVTTIMPKIYAQSHHSVLSRYIAASESKVNGFERIVPALTKDGLMLPVTALTKPLPTLTKGIQIIAFLAKYQQKAGDDDDGNRKINYMLYRSDTEQIMSISEGCFKEYGINPTLMYGNPYNMNNQLKINHIFGLSFQNSDDGKIAAALQVGEVMITINTKQLKDIFLINKGSNSSKILDQQDYLKDGVQKDVPIKITSASIYNGIPLRLLSIYQEKSIFENKSKIKHRISIKQSIKPKKSQQVKKKQDSILYEQFGKNETDDMKNLKDFKNFISIKRQPSAITAISTICIVFMIIVAGAITGLIINWLQVLAINSNALSLYELTLQTEISTPELLTQVQKHLITYSNVSGFTNIASINATTNNILQLLKRWQLEILPYKYYFNSAYNDQSTKYNFLSNGALQTQIIFQQALINEYINQIKSLVSTNLSSLLQANFSNNLYEMYISSKLNYLFSIRNQYNSSNTVITGWYSGLSSSSKTIIIAINMVIIGSVILWLILLLPYVLSVTKINNRVLSLFTLIPRIQVSKLIYNCLRFLSENLSEAVVNQDDLKLYQKSDDNSALKQNYVDSNAGSPSQYNIHSYDVTQGQLRRPSEFNKVIKDNKIGIQQRFQKMNNSEDRNKKLTICKFIGISILILGFILFYLLYSLNYLSTLQTSINNYFLVGRRPALIRNIKLFLTEFLLLNPNYQFSSQFLSMRNLNQNLISQFYILQANLLQLSLGSSQNLFNGFNGGDLCSQVSNFSSFAIFNQSLSAAECYSFNSGVLQKGLTTGVVSVLQDIRSTLSQFTNSVPQNVLVTKILQYDLVVKYIETPMLAVTASIQDMVNSTLNTTKLVIILSGLSFVAIIVASWRLIWSRYLSQLNVKIWRTKGLLNLIPMRIITSNDLLKNEFTSGQLEKAVR